MKTDATKNDATKTVAAGALLGLTWAASLRGWMVDLAGDGSTFTWTGTFLCLLLPGALVGGLLGRALDLRRSGRQPRWLTPAPLLFPLGTLALPGAIGHLIRTGEGSASIIMVLLAMLAGRSLSGRGRVWVRVVAGMSASPWYRFCSSLPAPRRTPGRPHCSPACTWRCPSRARYRCGPLPRPVRDFLSGAAISVGLCRFGAWITRATADLSRAVTDGRPPARWKPAPSAHSRSG